jgi:hypothetical protein
MKAKYGSIIVSGSGSLGGHVYSASRKGFTARNAPIGSNQATAFQLAQRSLFFTVSKAWRKLSDAQRKAWFSFSFEGHSGLGAFVYVNLNRLHFYSTLAQLPPPIENFPFPSLVSLTCQASNQSIVLRWNASRNISYAYYVHLTRCMSAGRLAKRSDYRLLSSQVGNNTPLLDVSSVWVAKFGATLKAGLAVNVRVELMRNGLIYNTSYLTSIVI